MSEKIALTGIQAEEVKTLADETRKSMGIYGDVPIASDIFRLLEKKGIILCQYPFQSSEDSHTDATITWFETKEGPITFIGLNTSRCYDEQIFALAHELYHFITKTGRAYCIQTELQDRLTESKADRFAAELLLPRDALKSAVSRGFEKCNPNESGHLRLLRFLARLQCEWCLPYHALVNRLYEESYINKPTYDRLYEVCDRKENSDYCRILKSMDQEKFRLLNEKTYRKGISGDVLEIIIQNYENGITPTDEFIHILELFGNTPEDFGFDLSADSQDLDQLDELFEGGEPDES